jgi:hypothetical protein
VSEERHTDQGSDRDRAAARRVVDAGIRDRMADEEMPEPERDARAAAARGRMAAMQDRRTAARDRAEGERRGERDIPDDARDPEGG